MDSITTVNLLTTARLGVSHLHTAQMGISMQSMDSMKYSATVAKRVDKALSSAKFSVSEASEKSAALAYLSCKRKPYYPKYSLFS